MGVPPMRRPREKKQPNTEWTYTPRRDQAETHAAFMAEVAAVNRRIDDADNKWGRGRLPSVVSYETRKRYVKQFTLWHTACLDGTMAEVTAHGAGMRRAYDFMDQEATTAGVEQMPARCVDGIKEDGRRLVIVQDAATIVGDETAEVWTVEAAIKLIEAHRPDTAAQVLEAFNGAKIEDYRLREEPDIAKFLGV
tara:strand:- start:642 stop:1223 length:582 start_codon:yes stop_codon:yes gene_type:complete